MVSNFVPGGFEVYLRQNRDHHHVSLVTDDNKLLKPIHI